MCYAPLPPPPTHTYSTHRTPFIHKYLAYYSYLGTVTNGGYCTLTPQQYQSGLMERMIKRIGGNCGNYPPVVLSSFSSSNLFYSSLILFLSRLLTHSLFFFIFFFFFLVFLLLFFLFIFLLLFFPP